MRNVAAAGAALIGLAGAAARGDAQDSARAGGRNEVFAASEIENYLRYLQTTGTVAAYPWSIRGFSAHELDRMLPATAAHPWAGHYNLRPHRGRGSIDVVRPTTSVRFNSAFAYGSNDGPIWAGRGLTSAVQLGVSARYGPLSAVLAPIAFRAENQPFTLLGPAETTGRARFADGVWGTFVDRPQRFGDGAYTMVDLGQSTVRLDAAGLALGVSTANQAWGPGDRYNMVLGNNAAGFPHAFVGTSHPLNLWVARVHARVVYGTLSQSTQSLIQGPTHARGPDQPGTRRFTSGLVATVQPRGLRGLELGGARFFHSPWREEGPLRPDFLRPFEGILKKTLTPSGQLPGDQFADVDNQLASIFGRWVFAPAGLELSAEYFREDHSFDTRDLVLEPDHNAGYALNVRKAYRRRDGSMLAVRGELVSLEMQPIGQWRAQGLNYLHGYLRQGHTQRGQLLGADVGVGSAAGSTLAVDWYTPRGRWTGAWTRTLRQTPYLRNDQGLAVRAEANDSTALDVTHALGAEALLFRGRFDVTGGLTAVLNYNRNFADADVFNLNALLAVRTTLF